MLLRYGRKQRVNGWPAIIVSAAHLRHPRRSQDVGAVHDINGAVTDMTNLGISPALQRATISGTLNPHLGRRALQDFARYGTPEKQGQLLRFLGVQ